MKGSAKVIEQLQMLLESELSAFDQYFIHAVDESMGDAIHASWQVGSVWSASTGTGHVYGEIVI